MKKLKKIQIPALTSVEQNKLRGGFAEIGTGPLFDLMGNVNCTKIKRSIALALNFNKLQMYASNVHQIQETAQNSLTLQAI